MTEQDVQVTSWIELKQEHQQDQLFAACPVCFLSVATVSGAHNVMVISWLIPSGEGRLVMSMNQRRHTSSMLQPHGDFCLSLVPPGMEQMALDVASLSGQWGKSKFPQDYPPCISTAIMDNQDQPRRSKRARKKQQFERGVPGLKRATLGNGNQDSKVFAIEGTLAHVHCQVLSKQESVIDEEHFLLQVKIQRAFVRESHWDMETNTFAPRDGNHPSTLTFFGSQSFGYVWTDPLPARKSNCTSDERGFHRAQQIEPCNPWIRLDQGKQFSRLLYTNPLCLMQINARLTTVAERKQNQSVTIVELSRLTATNNTGAFMFCMRASKARMLMGVDTNLSCNNTESLNAIKRFTLSVPVQGMECMLQTLVAEGTHLDAGVPWATIGTKEINDHGLKGIKGCTAHLRCRVYDSQPQGSSEDDKSCMILLAQVEEAFVHSNYWDTTKSRFAPKVGCPPYMKRFGKEMFGYVLSISTNSLS